MRLRPSIEAADLPQIRGARQPLPKTARCRLGCSRRDTLERRARICANRTVCSGRVGPERSHSTRADLACQDGLTAPESATQTQPLDERAIPLDIDLGYVLDQPPP